MIRTRNKARILGLGAGFVATLAACGQKAEQSAAPQVQEKSFTVTPASASVKISFLTGQLQDVKVTERVEQGTGKVVDQPRLHATLKLKNTSPDQAARLISGKIIYADMEGKPISLAEGRGDTSFSLPSYQSDRLDPGKETSHDIDVPFPAAGLQTEKLGDIRLELTYIPMPYKIETVKIPVALGS